MNISFYCYYRRPGHALVKASLVPLPTKFPSTPGTLPQNWLISMVTVLWVAMATPWYTVMMISSTCLVAGPWSMVYSMISGSIASTRVPGHRSNLWKPVISQVLGRLLGTSYFIIIIIIINLFIFVGFYFFRWLVYLWN